MGAAEKRLIIAEVGSLATGVDTFTFLLIHQLGKRFLELFILILISLPSGQHRASLPGMDSLMWGLPGSPQVAHLLPGEFVLDASFCRTVPAWIQFPLRRLCRTAACGECGCHDHAAQLIPAQRHLQAASQTQKSHSTRSKSLASCSFFLHAFIAFCGGHDGLPNVQALPTGRMWSMSGKPTSTQQSPGQVVGQWLVFSESNLNPKILPKSVFSFSSSKILLPL